MTTPPRVTELDWAVQRGPFQPDGTMRNIYVLGTTLADWQRVVELVERRFEARFDDSPDAPATEDIEALFATAPIHRPWLVFQVAGVTLACHFFTVDEIELDFLPDDVGEPELRALLELMADLGDLTSKPVIMTPEHHQEGRFFEYDPSTGRVRWIPRG